MPRRDSTHLPAMPWYGADFRRATAMLSRPAKLLYRELIDLYWDQLGVLELDPERLALAIACSREEWDRAWPEVAPFWDIELDIKTGKHRLSNARAKHELRFVQDRVEQRREAGRKGGKASAAVRWNPNGDKGKVTTAYTPAYSETVSDRAPGAAPGAQTKSNPPTPTPRSKKETPEPNGSSPLGKGEKNNAKSTSENGSPGKKFDPLAMDLPTCVTPRTWAEFVGHRNDLRKPLTERAANGALKALEQAAHAGETPEAVVERSIVGGYTGLFPNNRTTGSNGQRAPPQRALSAPERVEAAIARERAADARDVTATGRTFEHDSAGALPDGRSD